MACSLVMRHTDNELLFCLVVQHMDIATKHNKAMSVWHVTRVHATREQPMDTGPNTFVTALILFRSSCTLLPWTNCTTTQLHRVVV